jgi:hypothetical protein
MTYELLSKTSVTNPSWTSEVTLLGAAGQNSTPATITIGNRTKALYLWARSYIDSTGSGIADWWYQQYFGSNPTNWPDPYSLEPSHDGWTILQAYQNGWNPRDPHTPPTPTGLAVKYYGTSTNVVVTWNPNPVPVTGYLVGRYTLSWDASTNYFSLSSNQTALLDTLSSGSADPASPPNYQVKALYPGGAASSWTAPVPIYAADTSPQTPYREGSGWDYYWLYPNPLPPAAATVVRGPQGHLYLVTGHLPQAVQTLRVWAEPPAGDYLDFWSFTYPVTPEANYLWEHPRSLTNAPATNYWEVSASALQTGSCELPSSLVQPYQAYTFRIQAVAPDGRLSECPIIHGYARDSWNWAFGSACALPFLDGRQHIQQNIEFQLRAAMGHYTDFFGFTNEVPFEVWQNACIDSNPSSFDEYAAVDYVSAGFEYYSYFISGGLPSWGLVLDALRPFEQNYFYANFLWAGPAWGTGAWPSGAFCDPSWPPVSWAVNKFPYPGPYEKYQVDQPWSQFSARAFALSGTTNPPSPVLSPSSAQWIYLSDPWDFADSLWSFSTGFNPCTVCDDFPNLYGLPLLSVKAVNWNLWYGPTNSFLTAHPGDTLSLDYYAYFVEVKRPALSTVGYYFARSQPVWTQYPSTEWAGTNLDIRPGEPGFCNTNTTPLIITPSGQPLFLTAWAKQAITNGYANKFAYPEQYFDKALKIDDNGDITTNQTGILSPYGEFFPTEPGPVALTTMPDGATGSTGTGVVNVIKLQLDVNHDGTMDLSFGGPDNTSQRNPFVFWLDNDFDRLAWDDDDKTYYEDSVQAPKIPGWQGRWPFGFTMPPDGDNRDTNRNRAIPSQRDLEDFARLWACGISTNLLAQLPPGTTITLDWGDMGDPNTNNPAIDLFQAADPDGGTGYLTNAATAALQTNASICGYIGRLGPGQSIQLNDTNRFSNGWAGDHPIWCGVGGGTGQLRLTISRGGTNTLAQTAAYIQLVDIKQMYERWTVGENPKAVPTNQACLALEDLPPGISSFQYGPPTDTNTPYILFVHGWNLDRWEKDRFAERAFKRLYWQGYPGRFGSFRWPTDFNFKGTRTQLVQHPDQTHNFDRSEHQAWRSAEGLLHLLTALHTAYGSHLYLYSASLGNITCGEALRLTGTTQLVNTYVASQAALTAHTYDPTVPNYSFVYWYGLIPLSLSPHTPNIYGSWFATDNGRGAGQIINFFNQNDYALQRDVWQLNQLLKPDQSVAQADGTWNYAYNGNTSDPAPWNNFYKYYRYYVSTNAFTNTVTFDIVNTLTNRYEVMAFDAQSWTTALGATVQGGTPGVLNGVFRNINLGRDTTPRIWPPDTVHPDSPYNEHLYHSGQFRGPYWQQQGYWSELLGPEAFNLHQP